jgi:hypothetical protein
MATNSKVFVSPGVYTSERELSFVSQSIGITTLGIVGETLQGPAFEPIFIKNYDEFQTYFGGTTPEKFTGTQIPKYEAAYIAKAYLQQSNQLFVTRVLGLSGYDAGPSWSIVAKANIDPYSVRWNTACEPVPVYSADPPYCDFVCEAPVGTAICFDFSGDINNLTITPDNPIIAAKLDVVYTKSDGSTSTLRNDLESQIIEIFGNPSLSASSIYYFGTIWQDDYAGLSALTSQTNVFGVNNVNSADADFSSRDNDTWYYALFDTTGTTDCTYLGYSFYTTIDGALTIDPGTCYGNAVSTTTTDNTTQDPCDPFIPNPTPVTTTTTTCDPGFIEGKLCGLIYELRGDCYSEYDNLVVATFRSRGISEYVGNNHGQLYEVTNLNNVNLDFTGSYSATFNNPYATFGINVTSDCGEIYHFKASMTSYNTNYVSKVFGQTNFGKEKDEVPLMVEEKYDALLNWAFNKGYIRGLKNTLVRLDSARSGDVDGIAYYNERYQTPESPWIVSELRGSVVYRLFKIITISDGNSANRQIKVSFANMSFDNNRFDVLVRDYFDTDESPVVIEKFANCSMDKNQNNYIAKKIGTSAGDFQLNSKFIMIEVNEEAPFDALPCGFEGYIHKVYKGANSPFPIYKTKYTEAGEVIFNPPFGNSFGEDEVRSNGDVVRRTYLGISNNQEAGWDGDFFEYIGKKNNGNFSSPDLSDWNFLSKGFHMDSGATTILVGPSYTTSGQAAFACGSAEFRGEPYDQSNPYYRLFARKFTVFVKGGFDGWDIYRKWRTNDDSFQLGKSGFLKGAKSSPRFPNASGDGLFKVITIEDDTFNWGNTDYYAYLYGQKTFNNPQAININVFVTPGIDYVNNTQLVKSAINMVELDRADSIYITTTPDWNMFLPSANNPTDFIQAIDAVDNLSLTDIDSNYTSTYYPWVLTKDSVNLSQIYIPPTAEVCRNLALTDNIAYPWFATAGYTRGLVNAVKARRKVTQEERDTLYIGRINPIATFADVGPVIWGNKTLQIRESPLDRINVRRLLLQARKLISAVAVRLLFEQNDDKVRQDFLNAVNPILDAIRRDRGLYDFRVTVSNDIEEFDKNQMSGKIFIKPTRALEFIDIEFVITPTGASFENV